MLRSLYAGISGLKIFQTGLDVTSTNLANVNTTGYKGSRVTFKDIMSQTLKVAAAPNAATGTGGINPLQVGLGSSVSSIDTVTTQGNLQPTNNFTDLALQGSGFFALSNGTQTFYTRAGTFSFDKDGYLVSNSNAYKVQGYNATNGVMGSSVEGVQVPTGIILPAKATSSFELTGNLNAASEQTGTVLSAGITLAIDDGSSDLNGLYAGFDGGSGNLNDFISGLTSGQTTFTVNDVTGGTSEIYTYKTGVLSAGQFNTMQDLVANINADFAGVLTASITPGGALRLTNASLVAHDVTVASSNTMLQTATSSLGGTYAAGGTKDADQFSHRATESDLIVDLRNSAGDSLGVVATDIINLSANIGGASLPSTGTVTVTGATTLKNLDDAISTAFALTNPDNAKMTSTGQLQVTGDGGTSYAITNLSITAESSGAVPRAAWNNVYEGTGTNWSQAQAAQDNYRNELVVYDQDGVAHTLTLSANIRSTSGGLMQWVYNVSSVDSKSGVADAVSPSAGTITFNSDGSLSAFSPSTITVTPSGVASPFTMQLDAGTTNGFDGLVCFDATNTAVLKNQNGYASGELDSVTIDQTGLVVGTFTNGKNLDLAQILVAKFDNPAGLERKGDSMWTETRNSGLPNLGTPGQGGRALVLTSTLEMSNVDLSSEFTNMIVMERGFQANSSSIKTSDTILQELIQLKR